ncbi:hypothetical protein PYW07_002456 [Mythimna separata]|uniref:Lipase domain-containing protein n=1 Tax=Mythimna separata TaxID=271217 RepID=A0AAD7YMB3_MYTSE|nr:hypothetical protein PYW07_002456 [Mythimna separata]
MCYVGSIDNYKRVNYTNAKELITSGYFNVTRRSFFYAHGYRGSLSTQGTNVITEAILKTFDWNMCAIDYEKEANIGMIPFLNFPAVVAAAYVVQRELAEALKILWQNGMKPENVHMAGLSMGAHVCGNAARSFSQSTGHPIARCTGFDPAKPSFDGSVTLTPRIDQTCADFVDIIHTDTNRYGMSTPTGHVDYFANLIEYKEKGVQPGCLPVNLFLRPALTPEDACSHRRSLDLGIEAYLRNNSLQAAKASSEDEWASPGFGATVTAILGLNTDQTLRGKFYFRTADRPPYGLGEAGLTAQ